MAEECSLEDRPCLSLGECDRGRDSTSSASCPTPPQSLELPGCRCVVRPKQLPWEMQPPALTIWGFLSGWPACPGPLHGFPIEASADHKPLPVSHWDSPPASRFPGTHTAVTTLSPAPASPHSAARRETHFSQRNAGFCGQYAEVTWSFLGD